MLQIDDPAMDDGLAGHVNRRQSINFASHVDRTRILFRSRSVPAAFSFGSAYVTRCRAIKTTRETAKTKIHVFRTGNIGV